AGGNATDAAGPGSECRAAASFWYHARNRAAVDRARGRRRSARGRRSRARGGGVCDRRLTLPTSPSFSHRNAVGALCAAFVARAHALLCQVTQISNISAL